MFKTFPISLKSLLDDAASGKIQLPDFQRGWVWDDDRIRGLLASISRGFPVGAIMTLQAGGEIRLKSRMIEGAEGNNADEVQEFLLDGQQRLTSLYQSLLHEGPVDTHDNRGRRIKRWYYIDMLAAMDPTIDREDAIISVPEDRKETRNFGREIVRDLSSDELEYQQHMMPTERLLDSMDWVFEYNDYWQSGNGEHPSKSLSEFRNNFRRSVIDAFTGYDLPVITLDKGTPKEAVCTVFEKVNTGGVTLSVFELVTATFAAQDDEFSLREDWAERRSRLHNGYGVLQSVEGDQFLQAIALLSTQARRRRAIAASEPQNRIPAINCRKNDILNLEVSDYHQWADRVEAGFAEAAKFLRSQFVFTSRDVPYTTQSVPLATLFVELGNELEPANAKAKLERWFWSGIFGEAYGGAVETQYGLDLVQVADWIRGGPEPQLVSEANFIPERLLSLRTRQSAAYKGLYALQMKSGAADWRTNDTLTFATWHDENIDIHHIFPRRWCEATKHDSGEPKNPIPPRLFNSIINKTPIDAKTNKIIGGRAPSRYLPRLEQDNSERLDKVLKSHWISPVSLGDDNFAECFVERGEAMLELIGRAMGKSIQGGREAFWNALSSAGFVEEFDQLEDEHDTVGERAYDDDVAQVAD
ncbi:MAG: DUF262 domain-containing protein [Chloroflexota bacterium]|nr:DUF262 domain-containing protein [Chloroflexota bacterium]MDE2960706.1 DUF262 domain-containing protein [Chloroflexota bacterium]